MSSSRPPGHGQHEPVLPGLHGALTLLLPVLLPLGVLLLQVMLWDLVAPYGWIAFLPAVAASGWLSGLRGGLLAALLSIAATEWLLTLPAIVAGPEARAFAALLFSVLAAVVLVMLDQVRRERIELHGAITRLAAGGEPVTPARLPPWRAWQRNYAADRAALAGLARELAWRRELPEALAQPLALFASGGRCLFANAAFHRLVGTEDSPQAARNGLHAADFPGTGLALGLKRLLDQPLPRAPGIVQFGSGIEGRISWIGRADEGVAVCSVERAPAVAPLPPPAVIAKAEPAVATPGPAPAIRPLAPPPAQPATGSPMPASAVPVPAVRREVPAPVQQATRRRAAAGLRCLVVDDHEINRSLLREILHFDGAVVTLCASGREAVAAVSADPEGFDVVLMDLQMPIMDGYAAARAIRTLVDPVRLPILAITADGPGVPAARLRESGMQGLLHKPLEVDRLLALLQESQAAGR